jgi:hypothetical protein
MSDDAQKAEVIEALKKLTAQQEATLAILATFTARLDESEKRRQCLWLLNSIGQTMARLKVRSPEYERTFAEIFEALDCYTSLTFKSTEDLHTLFSFLGLVAGSLEELSKGGISTEDYFRHIKMIRGILDELQTLEDGDPPGLSVADRSLRDVCYPERRDAERMAVRDRAEQRVKASIDEMFARRAENRRNEFE